MRWTELTLIPTAAMAAPVQWVACAGGPAKVKATTRSAISGLNGGMRDGRVLSRHSPAAPSEPNRSCQRQMTVLAFPVRRTISAVPCPAAVSRTILARQTCFCGLFRLATTAFNAARSVALSLIWVLSCIPQTRMTESAGESARESKSQIWSTRIMPCASKHAHQDMGYGPTTPRWRGPGARTATSGRSESSRVIWVHGGGLSAAKRDSLLAEYAVGCRHHVLIGASFTTICQAGAVDR